MSILDGVRLAGRVSGDSTVAYAWAYAMAAEGAAFFTPPERAQWLRALLLERERIANHLGDLGFLGNDAGLAFGLAQFSRLKEDVLRLNRRWFGHRYLMDAIVPGGVARDLDREGVAGVRAQIGALRAEVRRLKTHLRRAPGTAGSFHRRGARDAGAGRPARAVRAGRARERHVLGPAGAVSVHALRSRWMCAWPRIAMATWPRV